MASMNKKSIHIRNSLFQGCVFSMKKTLYFYDFLLEEEGKTSGNWLHLWVRQEI